MGTYLPSLLRTAPLKTIFEGGLLELIIHPIVAYLEVEMYGGSRSTTFRGRLVVLRGLLGLPGFEFGPVLLL